MEIRNSNQKVFRAQDNLLMIAMFSVIMLFACLTSAYIVSKAALASKWDIIQLSIMFYISTALIIISSVFAHFALKQCKLDNIKMTSRYLLLAIISGLLFFAFQFLGWRSMVLESKFLSGNNVSASYIYVLTITHFLHVVGGLISLVIIYFNSKNKKYNKLNFQGLKLGVRFWHFLGFVWIYLFLFLTLIN